jgi:hypothetical protein
MVRLRAKSEAQNVPRINTFQFLLVRLKGLGGEIISPPKVISKKGGELEGLPYESKAVRRCWQIVNKYGITMFLILIVVSCSYYLCFVI